MENSGVVANSGRTLIFEKRDIFKNGLDLQNNGNNNEKNNDNNNDHNRDNNNDNTQVRSIITPKFVVM